MADVDDEDDDLMSAEATSFWCKYAATDVLNLDKNEGRCFDGQLHLLFTGGWCSPDDDMACLRSPGP